MATNKFTHAIWWGNIVDESIQWNDHPRLYQSERDAEEVLPYLKKTYPKRVFEITRANERPVQ